jgi:hypothetical protein
LLTCRRVVAVDSFAGEWTKSLEHFATRVGYYPHLDVVVGSSPDALERFAPHEFDMCYIDGDHDFESVANDICACYRIVKEGGWMAGHDCFPGSHVKLAVEMLLGNPKLFSDSSWLIRRGPDDHAERMLDAKLADEAAVKELLGEPKVFDDTSWLIRRE